MKSIFRAILLGTLAIVAPATAWSQPPLAYTSPVGAATEISGYIWDPGYIEWTPDYTSYYNVCSPTVAYGAQFGWYSGSPRQTGGDGVRVTADANPLNSGGRTQSSYAAADAQTGTARAVVSADVSRACAVYPYSSLFMDAAGISTAQFYRGYTALEDPTSLRSRVDLNWSLEGSFSRLTWNGGGHATLHIYILTVPPSQPERGPVGGFIPGSLRLVYHDIDSRTWSGNVADCAPLQNCQPVPQDPFVGIRGQIDVLQAFQSATGRPMTAGDSFIIGVFLTVWTYTAPTQRELAFTTDFTASATILNNRIVWPQKQ